MDQFPDCFWSTRPMSLIIKIMPDSICRLFYLVGGGCQTWEGCRRLGVIFWVDFYWAGV